MHVTRHGAKRMKERNGLNKKSIDRMAKKALEEGISHSETKGQLNKWVTKVFFQNTNANNIKLYGDKAYIFSEENLITVLQIPSNLTKKMNYLVKENSKKRPYNKEKVAVSEASSKEVVPDKEKITTESIMESKTEADKPKTRRTRNKQASSSAISSIEDLKVYLKTLSTDEFDPSTMTMGIFESVRNSIKNESDLEAEMEKTIIISKKIEMINNAVKENWPCIISGVQNIMSFASK